MRHLSIFYWLTIGTLMSSVAVLDTPVAHAQQGRPLVTMSMGVVRNLQTDSDASSLSFYPEIQFNTILLNNVWASTTLDGSLYVGGWRDGEISFDDLPNNCIGCEAVLQEAHRNLLLGARIGLSDWYGNSFVSFTTGISRQYVSRSWVWAATNERENPDPSVSKSAFFALEAGVRLQQPTGQNFMVGIGTNIFWNVSGSDFGRRPRLALSLSASYVR